MKDAANLHLKVQELCDCFATTDPLKEMSEVSRSPEDDDSALKWVALAVLHGINSNAEEITLSKNKAGEVEVTAKYRTTQLPSPGAEVGAKVLEQLREITHIDKDKGKMMLALGFRNNDLDLKITTKRKKDKESVRIYFP
ncbi:MAG: hypothetical protein QNJ17_11180 [Desulfocapsaceae bacterium]|nr:hypothetical protein [Desulfocapsaceae bacterium]